MEVTVIGRDVWTRLIAEAAAVSDREICGLLLGTLDRIEDVQAAANVAANPADSFEIDPAALIAAHRAARAGGLAIVGCYHSHPSGSATPSVRDSAAAEPETLWLILAGEEARVWQAGEGGFTERSLNIAR